MRFLSIESTVWWTQLPFFEIESTRMKYDIAKQNPASIMQQKGA